MAHNLSPFLRSFVRNKECISSSIPALSWWMAGGITFPLFFFPFSRLSLLRFGFFSVVTAWSENGPSTWILIRRMTRRRRKKKNPLAKPTHRKQKQKTISHSIIFYSALFSFFLFFLPLFFLFGLECSSTYLNMHLLYGNVGQPWIVVGAISH